VNNNQFCAKWVLQRNPTGRAKVLDYGCGAGELVEELQKNKIDAYGCDVFYEGGDYSSSVTPSLMNSTIRRMKRGRIPFDDGTFDYVINKEVMEHVENLDEALAEIHRVLKPGGKVLSLFPDKGIWREGHCGIPFLHWFPKYSRPRILWAAAFRFLGMGHHKGGKGVMRWSKDFCEWLDKYTWYRSRDEIDRTYKKHFSEIEYIEDSWMRERFAQRLILPNYLPAPILRLLARKLGELVFVARKHL